MSASTTMLLKIQIPEGLDFSDLQMKRDPDGAVSFRWEPIVAICSASEIDIKIFSDSPEDSLADLLAHWYAAHISAGGAPDETYADMIGEVTAENDLGGGFSHPPGRA